MRACGMGTILVASSVVHGASSSFAAAPLISRRRCGRQGAVPLTPGWPQGYALQDIRRNRFHQRGGAPPCAGAARKVRSGSPPSARPRAGAAGAGLGIAPSGNLAATLLLRPGSAAKRMRRNSPLPRRWRCPTWRRILRRERAIAVKWPNDVLADGRKIAGILLESSGAGSRPAWLAIGIGVNLASHPEDTEFPATSLAALGVCRAVAATTRCAPRRRASQNGMRSGRADGFAPLRDAWLARAPGWASASARGWRTRKRAGVFEGIDESGALLLRRRLDARTHHRRRRGVLRVAMLLAIDAGNTNIVFAVHDGEKMRAEWRAVTEIARTADEYAVLLVAASGAAGAQLRRSRRAPSSRPWCRRRCSTCASFAAAISNANRWWSAIPTVDLGIAGQ